MNNINTIPSASCQHVLIVRIPKSNPKIIWFNAVSMSVAARASCSRTCRASLNRDDPFRTFLSDFNQLQDAFASNLKQFFIVGWGGYSVNQKESVLFYRDRFCRFASRWKTEKMTHNWFRICLNIFLNSLFNASSGPSGHSSNHSDEFIGYSEVGSNRVGLVPAMFASAIFE